MGTGTLKLRFLNSFYKYISGENINLPLFQGNDIPEFVHADTLDRLLSKNAISVASTNKYHFNNTLISEFTHKLCFDRKLNVSGIGIMYKGNLVSLYHKMPYTDEYRHVSYSMCKSITQMAVGIAYDENLLKLDEKLYNIFTEHNGVFLKKGMRDVTIEHLLTMRAGVKYDEINSFFHMDWCKSFMGFDLSFTPGEDFTYNSLNTYMLAAIIKIKTGLSMLDYLQNKLFDVMDIHDITWDKCPKGIEKGGWGLKLSIIDMLKLGQLYVDNGRYLKNGKWIQLISKEWIDKSTSEYTKFNDKKVLSGYGYQIWTLKDGAILFNGLFGQNVYINQQKKLVIATTASAYEVFPDGKLVDIIMKFANNKKLFVDKSFAPFYINNLKNANYTTCGLTYKIKKHIVNNLSKGFFSKKSTQKAYEYIHKSVTPYLDKWYRFDKYATSLMPITTQVMYSNYCMGISGICISFEKQNMYINIEDSGVIYKIKTGYSKNKPYEYQILTIGGKELPIAVSCNVEYDEDYRMYLAFKIVYLEEVSNKIIKLMFEEEEVSLSAYETPNMMEFSDLLVGEEKMRRTKILSRLHAPDFVLYRLHKIFTANRIIGKSEV